ncbi:MAG: hypothetical protein JW728_04275 [Candidatus Aureabacteria bacterium]|nr:hypothetical protein [Candidatus Auribacterota bacterium]
MKPLKRCANFTVFAAAMAVAAGCSLPGQDREKLAGGEVNTFFEDQIEETADKGNSEEPAIQKLPYVKKQKERIQKIYDEHNRELMDQMEQ